MLRGSLVRHISRWHAPIYLRCMTTTTAAASPSSSSSSSPSSSAAARALPAASGTPRRNAVHDALGARLSAADLSQAVRAVYPATGPFLHAIIAHVTGGFAREVDAWLQISRSQPPPVHDADPRLVHAFGSALPPLPSSRSSHLAAAAAAAASPEGHSGSDATTAKVGPSDAPDVSAPLPNVSVEDIERVLMPLFDAVAAADADANTSTNTDPPATRTSTMQTELSATWLASASALLHLRGPHAPALTTALVTHVSHFTRHFWPLVLPLLRTPCPSGLPAAVFQQTALTTHQYLHQARPRFATLWAAVLSSYWRPGVAADSPAAAQRREDLMLALTAFLLQRVPATPDAVAAAASLTDSAPLLPLSIPDSVTADSPLLASLGGPAGRNGPWHAHPTAAARTRAVLAVWVQVGLVSVSADGAGWMCASPASEEALLREICTRSDDYVEWMLAPERASVWLDTALAFAIATSDSSPLGLAATPYPATHLDAGTISNPTSRTSTTSSATNQEQWMADPMAPIEPRGGISKGATTATRTTSAGPADGLERSGPRPPVWYHPMRTDGRPVTDQQQPARYALRWRRLQRLQVQMSRPPPLPPRLPARP